MEDDPLALVVHPTPCVSEHDAGNVRGTGGITRLRMPFPFASDWFTVSLVPVESALDYDPQMGSIGLQQFHNPWQIVAQFLLNHYLKSLVDHTQVTISCTQIDSAVELHRRWPPFFVERLVKQTQFIRFAFGRLY